jgi:NAD(P)-dependent dehydrogenase (short-subunit alcohol dehydrogenase family)
MRVVVVTGSSSGIGLATALHFAGGGDQVFATMRDTSRRVDLDRAAASADLAVGVRPLDVRDEDQVRSTLAGIVAEAGRIDVLVNNAGIATMKPWEFTPMDQIKDIFETNLFGAVRCAQAVLPIMRQQGHGAIVNVASVAGRIAAPIQGPYCATKYAMVCFTQSLAVEGRPFGVRVAAVLPGFISTPILDRAWSEYTADDANPYADIWRRWAALYEQGKAMASDPAEVAVAIDRATQDDAELISIVGESGFALVNGFERLDDAGWLAYGDRQSDEDWFGRFMADFPMAPA